MLFVSSDTWGTEVFANDLDKVLATPRRCHTLASDEDMLAHVARMDYPITDAVLDLPQVEMPDMPLTGYFSSTWAYSEILLPLGFLAHLKRKGLYSGVPKILYPAKPSRVSWGTAATAAVVKALTQHSFLEEFLC